MLMIFGESSSASEIVSQFLCTLGPSLVNLTVLSQCLTPYPDQHLVFLWYPAGFSIDISGMTSMCYLSAITPLVGQI